MPNALPYDNSLDGLERNIKYVVERLERVEERLGITPPPPQPAEPDDDRNWAARSWRPPQAAQSEPPPAAPVTPPGQQPDERGWVTLPELTPQPTQPQPKPSVIGPVTPLPPTPVTLPPVTPPVVAASVAPLPDIMGIPDPTTAEPQPVVAAPFTPAPPPPPVVPPAPRVTAGRDWENLIGGKWALWVGLFSLFLAIASFLAYTWKSLPPLPPEGRLALGIGAGIVMLGAGSFFRSRAQRWFSEGLMGAGLAVLYLSIWVGAQQYHLLSFPTAFTSMALVTALGVYLAVRQDALSLSLLATLGGFLTPMLLNSGTGAASGPMPLLTYVAVLNAGILGVSLFKRWNSLTWLSFIATFLLVGGWGWDNYMPSSAAAIFAYCTLLFAMYLVTATYYSLVRREETAASDLLLLFAAASSYALAGYGLLKDINPAYQVVFVLGLGVLFGGLSRATTRIAPHNVALQRSALGIAITMFTVALPIQFQGPVLAIAWSVEAAVLLVLGMQLRSRLFQAAGHWIWGLSLLSVMEVLGRSGTPGWQWPFVNERANALLVSLISTAIVLSQNRVIRHRHLTDAASQTSPDVEARPVLLDTFAPLYAFYVVIGGAWLVAQETFRWAMLSPWFDVTSPNQGAAYFMIGILALYATAAFAVGARLRDGVVRQSAMAVLAYTAALPLWSGLEQISPQWTPFFNLRSLSYLLVAVSLGLTGWLVHRHRAVLSDFERRLLGFWPVASGCFALLGATIELYSGFEAAGGTQWELNAAFAVAILWSVGAVLMAQVANVLQVGPLRQTALVIGILGGLLTLGVSLAYDSAAAPLFWNMRALAFGTVSLLLLAIALGAKRQTASGQKGWPDTTVTCALLGCLMLLWGVSQESYSAFIHYKAMLGQTWQLQAGFFLSVLWSAGALALLAAGLRWKQLAFRGAAYILFPLGLVMLCFTAIEAVKLGWAPLLNARFAAYVLLSGMSAVAALQLHRHADRLEPWEKDWSGFLGWVAGLLLLGGITQEIYESCYFYREALGSYWTRWAQMFISVAWSVYGTALLIAGINRNFKPLRLAALGLLCCTVFKVFLFDLGFLSGPIRMFSLAGLGLALIFISWLYSRYGKGESEEV